jgi:hypothetical protein
VAGAVQSVNGSTITVQTANGGTSTIQLSNSTTIRKQVTETVNDLKTGTPIFAVGQQNGNVFQARQITVRAGQGGGPNGNGGAFGAGNPRGNGNGNRSGGNGNTNGANGNGAPSFVNGTVDSVSGNAVTVKTAEGSSVQIQLASNGRIVATQSASASDVKPGEYLTAGGQNQGGAFVASNVNLSDSAPPARNAAG